MTDARPQTTDYRPDIDGLRAIAVLAVIFFHLHESLLPGGFVGVDVFFVISGFLITRNILREIERGAFSLLEFYRRRVKRIAPAMLVVVAVTLLFSQLLMLPEDARSASKTPSTTGIRNTPAMLASASTPSSARACAKPI